MVNKSGVGGESLVLLSERVSDKPDEGGRVNDGEKAAPDAIQTKALTEQTRQSVSEPELDMCWLIGPFQEVISGKQVINRLSALDIKLALQSIEIVGKTDYWVHLQPQLSRKAAIKLLRELQAKKIDSFLITEGELADGISLGFFTSEERAKNVLQERIKQGYEAKIKQVPRTHTELWAVFERGEYSKFSDTLWEKIKQGNKGLERRKNYCDKIASLENFD